MNVKKSYLIVLAIFWLVFWAWSLFRIQDNRDTVCPTCQQSERIREYQSEIINQLDGIKQGIGTAIDRVERAEKRIDTITESVSRIQEQNSNIYESVTESQRRIADSKRILEEVGKTKQTHKE